MLSTAKICALLLSGAVIGAGSTVAVTKKSSPKPSVSKTIKAKAKQPEESPPSRPRVGRVESRNPPAANILDCPTSGLGGFQIGPQSIGDLNYVEEPHTGPRTGYISGHNHSVDNGGGSLPGQPVPEADAWIMMLSGFGLIGLALRKRTSEKVSQ